MKTLRGTLSKLWRYPSAVIGALVVFALIFTAAYTLVKIPYSEAIRLWRGGEDVWYQNPKFAAPAWINLFSREKYAESFAVRTSDGSITNEVVPGAEGTATMSASYAFTFISDYLPQDMILYITSKYQAKQPFISATWLTPDGREIRIMNLAISQKHTYRFAQDQKLRTRLRTEDVISALFTDPQTGKIVKG